jgi:hypothetical protein
MTADELAAAHGWFCDRAYSPLQIVQRGARMLGRNPAPQLPRKLFGSFSTDLGYRRTYGWRHVQNERLLSAWSQADCA